MTKEIEFIIVLHPKVTREDFERVARELGLAPGQQSTGASETGGIVQSWTDPTGLEVRYVESPELHFRRFETRGQRSRKLLTKLSQQLRWVPEEELLETVEEDPDPEERARALLGVAAYHPEQDEGIVALYDFCSSPDQPPELRRAVLQAIAYGAWPGSLATVERLAREDPDPEIRAEAERVLPLLHQSSRS
jgi:hypothetical protein